jgi:hypothetical protein
MRAVGMLDSRDSRLIMAGEEVLDEPLQEETTGLLRPTIFGDPSTGVVRSSRSTFVMDRVDARKATSGEACASSWLRVRTVAGREMWAVVQRASCSSRTEP